MLKYLYRPQVDAVPSQRSGTRTQVLSLSLRLRGSSSASPAVPVLSGLIPILVFDRIQSAILGRSTKHLQLGVNDASVGTSRSH